MQDAAYYEYAESVPGPTVERFQAIAAETGMVMVLPVYEQEQPGVLYNTAAVIDADGTYLGKYRKTHIPQVQGLLGEVLLPARQPRVPGVRHRGRPGRRLHLLRPPLPRGLAGARPGGARIVFNPSATSRGLSMYLWQLEQPAAAVANEYFVGAINRVGVEDLGDNDFYGSSYFVDPRAQLVGDAASDGTDELVVRDLDMGVLAEVRDQWQFYRDRRPSMYGSLTEA